MLEKVPFPNDWRDSLGEAVWQWQTLFVRMSVLRKVSHMDFNKNSSQTAYAITRDRED